MNAPRRVTCPTCGRPDVVVLEDGPFVTYAAHASPDAPPPAPVCSASLTTKRTTSPVKFQPRRAKASLRSSTDLQRASAARPASPAPQGLPLAQRPSVLPSSTVRQAPAPGSDRPALEVAGPLFVFRRRRTHSLLFN